MKVGLFVNTQYPRRLRCRRPHPGDGGAGAGGARCRVRVAVVSASLADPPDADAADHPGHGIRRGARAGHDDRAEHPDPAAAQSGACRRGSRHARCADGRQLHPRRRARLSPAGVRGFRRSARRARAALHRGGRLDAPAVERGAGQPQGPVLYGQRCRHQPEAGAPGRAAGLYRRAGRCVGQARGADRRCLADRQQQRAEQDSAADANLSRRAERIRPHPDRIPDHASNVMSERVTRQRTRNAADRSNTNTTPTRPGGWRTGRPARSRISRATVSSSATRSR